MTPPKRKKKQANWCVPPKWVPEDKCDMKKTPKAVVDMCKCGHHLDMHQDCDCPSCPDMIHGCLEKVKKGNNRDFCECNEYQESTPIKKQRRGK